MNTVAKRVDVMGTCEGPPRSLPVALATTLGGTAAWVMLPTLPFTWTHMRRHFRLDDEELGIKSGGHGECQLSTGHRIKSTIAPT